MANPRKYLFDLSFDQPQGPVAVRFGRAPAEPTFSRTELEAARANAFEEGRQAAMAEAAASDERRLAEAISALAAGIPTLLARDVEVRHETETRAIGLLRLLLAKASPALAQKEPLAEIEAMIVTCLREAFEEPRIVVRVPQPLFEPIRGRLASLAHDGSFAGKFVLLVDDALGPADCRLEWADGGAERDTNRLARELDAALERALTTPTPEPSSQEMSHE